MSDVKVDFDLPKLTLDDLTGIKSAIDAGVQFVVVDEYNGIRTVVGIYREEFVPRD